MGGNGNITKPLFERAVIAEGGFCSSVAWISAQKFGGGGEVPC